MKDHNETAWYDREGVLADGTPLREVAAGMPVEARLPGSPVWHSGIVIRVAGPPGKETVRVEHGGRTAKYLPHCVRQRYG